MECICDIGHRKLKHITSFVGFFWSENLEELTLIKFWLFHHFFTTIELAGDILRSKLTYIYVYLLWLNFINNWDPTQPGQYCTTTSNTMFRMSPCTTKPLIQVLTLLTPCATNMSNSSLPCKLYNYHKILQGNTQWFSCAPMYWVYPPNQTNYVYSSASGLDQKTGNLRGLTLMNTARNMKTLIRWQPSNVISSKPIILEVWILSLRLSAFLTYYRQSWKKEAHSWLRSLTWQPPLIVMMKQIWINIDEIA